MTEFSRVFTKKLSNTDSALYRKLADLTRRGQEWDMRSMLSALKRGRGLNKAPALVHYIRDEKGRIAGWSISFDVEGEPWAYFYVRSEYRRNGLGTRLFKAAVKSNTRRFGKRTNVGSYSPEIRNFFMRAHQVLQPGRGCRRIRVNHQ